MSNNHVPLPKQLIPKIAIWDETNIGSQAYLEVKYGYNEKVKQFFDSLNQALHESETERFLAIIILNQALRLGDKPIRFAQDLHFLYICLKILLREKKFGRDSKRLALDKIEDLYEYMNDLFHSLWILTLTVAKEGDNYKRVLTDDGKMFVDAHNENEHLTIYKTYLVRQSLQQMPLHEDVVWEDNKKFMLEEYTRFNPFFESEFGCSVEEIIADLDKYIHDFVQSFKPWDLAMWNKINHDMFLMTYDQVLKIFPNKKKLVDAMIRDVDEMDSNIMETEYFPTPIYKAGSYYFTYPRMLTSGLPEVFIKVINEASKGEPYITKKFEQEVLDLVSKKGFEARSLKNKDCEGVCQIDCLFEANNKIYLVECKHQVPSLNYFAPHRAIQRAKTENKKYEGDIKRKLDYLNNSDKYNPERKEVVPLIVTKFPLYVSHYFMYLCLTFDEWDFCLEKYVMKDIEIPHQSEIFYWYIDKNWDDFVKFDSLD